MFWYFLSMPITDGPVEVPHEAFNIGVKALIVRNDRVLLLKRRDLPRWEVPGGRINQGENAFETLRRELAEELPHITHIRIGRMLHAEQADFLLPNGNHLMLLFYHVNARLLFPIELSEEHCETTWASLTELAAFKPPAAILTAARTALQTA
jgi:8-oxo-dGTP pyrophosphatase MutT (NUDIX family)